MTIKSTLCYSRKALCYSRNALYVFQRLTLCCSRIALSFSMLRASDRNQLGHVQVGGVGRLTIIALGVRLTTRSYALMPPHVHLTLQVSDHLRVVRPFTVQPRVGLPPSDVQPVRACNAQAHELNAVGGRPNAPPFLSSLVLQC